MKAEFRPTTPADAPALVEFLGRIFEAGPREPIIDPAMMHWKYWRERPGWPGSRSYVLERAGSIVAHGAAWPATILAGDGIPSFFLIDWAASPDFPGVGASVMRHMAKLVPVNFVYGGSEAARKMRFAMGYRNRNEVQTLALPLRPLRQILTSPWNWKTPARLVRNLVWSRGAAPPPANWRSQPISPRELSSSPIPWASPSPRDLLLQRDAELFTYLSDCPLTGAAVFIVLRDSQPVGYFCLTYPPGQARVADAWCGSEDLADWESLYRLAIHQARQDPKANEITAAGASDASIQALEQLGFHARALDPVQIYDPKGLVPPDVPLKVQLIDGDAAFRSLAIPSYLT